MFLLTFIFITLSFVSQVISESAESQLGLLMKELQEEMKELKKIRQTDSETIQKLQEELNRYTTKDFGVLPSTIRKVNKDFDLKSGDEFWRNAEALNREADLSESQLRLFHRQFPNSPSNVDAGKLETSRHETNFLRQEVLRLSKEMAEMKVHLADGVSLSSGRVAVRWLQATVEGLRREMKEMALSLNTSATLAEKQKTSTNFALIRSDIAALEHRMDSIRVDRERNTAVIQQLRRDVDELRLRLQETAAGQQRILVEVDSLKEELREHILLSKKKSSIFDDSGSNTKTDGLSWKTREREHPKFRHGQWKAEVENLHESVLNLEFVQSEFSKKLRDIQKNQITSVLKLDSLEKSYESIMNNSEPSDVEQRIFNQRLDVLESLVNKTEHQTIDIQSKVSNITSTEIRKLHGSTMQLFNALERLEGSYDRTTEDIRREISKLDYNFSQTQSDLEELSDRQLSFEQVISNMKNDITTVQSDLKSNHFRLLLVQNAVLNRTLTPGQQRTLANHDDRISALESKIHSLSSNVDAEKLEIETLHRQVVEKVDDKDFMKWEKAQRKVRESILQFKEDIPKIKQQQETIEEELEKFIHQLPQDCSGNSTFERFNERSSGAYLIRSPLDDSKASVKVFCDMETDGGQWTLIQRRSKGDVNFDKDWKHYKEGFGDVESGDFWIGNEILHKLTTTDNYILRIDLWNLSGTYKYAEYNTFEVLHEMDNYRLVIGGYHGNASDSMNYHNGMAFSTPDRDNDVSVATHCAKVYNSGWWYNHCQYVNINGRYSTGVTWYDIDGKEWSELMRVEMKIKLRTLKASIA